MRWFLFVISFAVFVMTSFWGYIWYHRVESVQDILQRAYPECVITVGSVEASLDGTLTLKKLLCGSKKHPSVSPITIHSIRVESSPLSWLSWWLQPSGQPLSFESMHISSDRPLPNKVIASIKDKCTIGSLHMSVED